MDFSPSKHQRIAREITVGDHTGTLVEATPGKSLRYRFLIGPGSASDIPVTLLQSKHFRPEGDPEKIWENRLGYPVWRFDAPSISIGINPRIYNSAGILEAISNHLLSKKNEHSCNELKIDLDTYKIAIKTTSLLRMLREFEYTFILQHKKKEEAQFDKSGISVRKAFMDALEEHLQFERSTFEGIPEGASYMDKGILTEVGARALEQKDLGDIPINTRIIRLFYILENTLPKNLALSVKYNLRNWDPKQPS